VHANDDFEDYWRSTSTTNDTESTRRYAGGKIPMAA